MDITLRRFCKLYTIVLLVLTVEATGSNSNDTSHDRRQSRVSGRIVKVYSGTRPEPILCAGEGFQADPHDCAVFYRCMKSGNGKYTVFRFQCGPGTVYDPETEVCNHPRSTKRSECGSLSPPPAAAVDRLNNNEIEGTQYEIPSPITNKPLRIESTTGTKTTFTTVYPWTAHSSTILAHSSTKRHTSEVSTLFSSSSPWVSTGGQIVSDYTVSPLILPQNTVTLNQQYTNVYKTTSSPTTSAIPQSNSRDNICTSDGFMGDSENCRKFYRCVANQRGTYTRFEFSCGESTVWDDDTQSCNHAWAVKRSRCGRSNQDSQITTNAGNLQKDSSSDKTIQQQLQVSFGSKVTQTQTQIGNGSVTQNQTQINYGDRLNQNITKAKQNQTQISHGSAVSQTQTQIDYSDKGVQTQLQIDHSQQASQTQIQVHESTSARPSTSTAPSTSHVGTQEGNRCGRSGFMGDTNDCKKFYRCVDNGRGGYTKFEFLCGEGTVWDQSIEACNHAWAVKDCGGKGSAETTSTTQAAISTSQSTQNYYTTVSTDNHHTTSELIDNEDNEDSGYGHPNQNPTTSPSTTSSSTIWSSTAWSSTTVSPTTAKSPSNGSCQSSGFIGDANDCKIFYRCVENGRGSFTKYEFKCGEGTVWDPDLEACNHAWAVKRCGGTASLDIDKVETTTEQQITLSTAHTQSPTVTTSPIESAATVNDDYDTGYGSANNDLTSSTTTTTNQPPTQEPSVSTICTSSGFIGDANDCKKFYRCVDNGNGSYTRYEFTCGEGTVWDPKIDACNHAWVVEKCGGSSAAHQEATTQTKPTTTHEIIDSSTTEGAQSTGSSTNLPSTTYSTSTITESVSMSSNHCTKSGFMGDLKDCKKFYRCVDDGKGSFTQYEFSCGEGTVWDQKIEACNHAWAVENCGGTADSSTSHHETTTQYHPTMSDEIDNGYPSNVDTGSEMTTQSTTTHSTTESSKEPSKGNNCINSGFIGDKNDCKKFYRCVDDGNGKYIRYEFNCGEGTLWDQSIEACNHAWAVKDCGKTGNNTAQPSGEYPAQGTLTTETEDEGYPQSTEKTSTSTVSTYPDSETGEACSKEGFMGDKNNCKKFYRCVDNGRGGFTKYEFNCGEGTYWSQEILSCDHATSDKTCGEKESGSSTQTSQPEHDEIYTEATSTTSSSTEGNVNEHQTQQPPASSGICTSEGFYGEQYDCKNFYRCVDNGKGGYTKYDFTCGEGTVWDQEIQACNHESSNKKCSPSSPPTAQTTEDQPEPGNDNSMTTVSQIQHSTEKTETSSTSTSSSNQCSSGGFFADPNDCKKFIRCVSNGKGGYTKYQFTCGEGTIWVQDIQACDHDTGDAICSSQTTNKPLPTEGHQQTTEKYEVGTSTAEPQTIDKQEDEYDNGNSNKPSQSGSGVCSSEGFYGNENDCRQFYRCVDNGQGGYTKYDFTCGDGTAWDSEIQNCNHIDQVKTCNAASETQPVMHDEDHSPSTESSTTASSSTTSSGTTSSGATSSSSTSSSTTDSGSNQATSSGNKDTCDSEGYFGNSQDCKKFYRCVDNGKEGYTKYDYTCGEGTIWDQDVTTCNHPQDVVNPSCNQNQDGSTTSTTAVSSSSSSESSPTSESSSSSDSSSSTSSSSQSTTESLQGSSNCSQEDSSKKPGNQDITCDKAGYFANPNDCKKFYRCVDWDGDGKRFSVYHFDCGEGTIWDPAVETCNHEESVYPPRDCSGSQSQSENQPATEGTTTTTQQDITSSQESTSTQTTSTTQSSAEQTTQSTTSEPTTTQQSTSTDITTTQQSTTSEQTTTQKSTTSEQTTQQSTTSKPTTQQSTTSEQTTQQSTTSEQTTQQPSSSEQTTTQQSTTSEQTTTQQSTTSEKTTTTEQSTTSEQTTTQQSTTSEPTTTEQSTTSEQTTTQQSTTSEQTTTEQSTTSEQTTQEPTTSEQTTQASTTTEQSTTSEQTTTEQSSTSESTTEQSTLTTESSTTEQSTTQQSTTTEKSEQSTTEESTSSEGSTTEQSTTEQSTTEQTNESSTTESSTDESTTEKKCPETDENQSLFVCPTSFKRHPKYCNLFYQCDEDDDTHDVKIAVFTCPNNTIYDESQTRCVEESKADKKCEGNIAQKRRFKRLDRNYKEPLVVTKESHACPSAGYFSFEKDSECSPAFLKCKTDKTNKLRGLVYQCPSGYVYWSISKRCEPMNKVRDCKRSQNNWTGRWEIPIETRNVAPS